MDTLEIFRHLLKKIIASREHGFQGKLAKKCDIEPKYFSECLNNPEIRLSELKRIAIIESLGYEYDEFLSMGKGEVEMDSEGNLIPLKTTQTIKRIYSRASDCEKSTGDMLANFSNKKKARECYEKLLEIDHIDPDKLNSINFIIHAFLEGLRPQKKSGT